MKRALITGITGQDGSYLRVFTRERLRSSRHRPARQHVSAWIGRNIETRRALRAPGAEVDFLIGDAAKARKILGWEPKVRFEELVRIMVDADMDLLSRETPRKQLGKLP
jgi:GDP-D-mannose dehydratase